jgi:hypothetical protein
VSSTGLSTTASGMSAGLACLAETLSMDLGAVARDQAGVFVSAQAHACGLSTYQIRRRRATGEFVPALGSALAFAGAPIVAESLDWAAYLSAGSDAVMSGASAAARHRIKVVGPRPCVTVPVRRHLQLEGVTLLRDDLPDDDVDFVAGAAVTSLPRTVVDCLALAGDRQALALLDRALQRYWITWKCWSPTFGPGRVREVPSGCGGSFVSLPPAPVPTPSAYSSSAVRGPV